MLVVYLVMLSAKSNSALLKTQRCKLVERHFMNSQSFMSKDDVLFKIGPKRRKCRSIYQATAILRTQPSTKAQFGIDLEVGAYSLGSSIYAQTYLADFHAEPQNDDFSFVSVKFQLGLTDKQMLLLRPQNVLIDEKTYYQEYDEGEITKAFLPLVNRLHVLTRPLAPEEIEKIKDVEDKIEYCFAFRRFTDMTHESFKKITQYIVPCLEKSFVLKIANHLLYSGYIERVCSDSVPYEPLTLENLENCLFKIPVIRDSGRKMGELLCDMKMYTHSESGEKHTEGMDLYKCFSKEEESISTQNYMKTEVAVDHTSPLYYRSRSVECSGCGHAMALCKAKPCFMRMVGDGYFDFTDVANLRCNACRQGELIYKPLSFMRMDG